MQSVKKAVIPAAGFGTRVLPFTKAVPKEMLPIVGKPSIQYIVEEAVSAGIEDILIIVSRGKGAIEDHFDYSPDLERQLEQSGKIELLEDVRRIAQLANITFLRQKEMRGLGHAISCARGFTGGDPFAVLYGDDVIIGQPPVTGQLIDAYETYGLPCCGIKQVLPENICKYSSLKVDPLHGRLYRVTDMIEKPKKGEAFSLFSILGRVLLTAEIYPILENTRPGAGGEIQLTDAMRVMSRGAGMTGVDFIGERYDMGNKFEILKANIEVGLSHPETAAPLKEYLRALQKNSL